MIKNYAILIIKYTVVVLLFSLIVELVRIPINIIFSKDALFVTAINIGLTEVMKIILTIYLYKWLMKKTDTNVVLNRLLSKYPYKVSIVLSALIFGLGHFDIEQGVNAFFIGCLLGYIYYRTGSLLTTIILHSLINLYQISSTVVKFMSQVPPLYFQIGEVAVGFVILVVLVRGYRRGREDGVKDNVRYN